MSQAEERGSTPLIAIDASRGFDGRVTGTERYARSLIEALVSRTGFRWRLYHRGVPDREAPSAPHVDSRVLPPAKAWTHRCLGPALRRDAPDIVFIPAHVLPIGLHIPAVVTVHDLGFLAWPDAHPFLHRIYLRWSTRRHVRKAAHIVTDSGHTRGDLVRRLGADPTRITVAPLGADRRWRPATEAEVRRARERIGLDGDPFLLHVGTLQPRKNLERLVVAFDRVSGRYPELRLVLAGADGWGDLRLDRLASALGIEGRVHVPGYVPDHVLRGLYSDCAAVVIPSLYEGFGLPALEAMACGAPVAVSDSSSLPEVVGDVGWLFDPEDIGEMVSTILSILGAPRRAAQRAACGPRRARAFTWDRCADRVVDALHSALRDGGPR